MKEQLSQPVIVELHPAHIWDCPECGAENFCRCVVMELSVEEREEMQSQMEPGEFGDWVTSPDSVTCNQCGREFRTEDMRDAML